MKLWNLLPNKIFGFIKCQFKLPNQVKPIIYYGKVQKAKYSEDSFIIFRNEFYLIPPRTQPPYYFYIDVPRPIAYKLLESDITEK